MVIRTTILISYPLIPTCVPETHSDQLSEESFTLSNSLADVEPIAVPIQQYIDGESLLSNHSIDVQLSLYGYRVGHRTLSLLVISQEVSP